MDELGAIEEEEHAVLNANGTDSIIVQADSNFKAFRGSNSRKNSLD